MHHKRGRAKAQRAGCLLCKPNKLGQGMENKVRHQGFSGVRQEIVAKIDMRASTMESAEESGLAR